LFAKEHGRPIETRTSADIPDLAREARAVLRQHFLSAEMGISGANFLIAETGSAALVTNEGNGRMVTTLPRVHVVITGIEKLVPTLEDFATLMRLLPRSATGQAISNYVSLLTGTKRDGDLATARKRRSSSWSTTAVPSCSARTIRTCCAASAAAPA
jgi:L-lactate dehydrogenase complex protein LldF